MLATDGRSRKEWGRAIPDYLVRDFSTPPCNSRQ
jgi:hypothetical protein